MDATKTICIKVGTEYFKRLKVRIAELGLDMKAYITGLIDRDVSSPQKTNPSIVNSFQNLVAIMDDSDRLAAVEIIQRNLIPYKPERKRGINSDLTIPRPKRPLSENEIAESIIKSQETDDCKDPALLIVREAQKMKYETEVALDNEPPSPNKKGGNGKLRGTENEEDKWEDEKDEWKDVKDNNDKDEFKSVKQEERKEEDQVEAVGVDDDVDSDEPTWVIGAPDAYKGLVNEDESSAVIEEALSKPIEVKAPRVLDYDPDDVRKGGKVKYTTQPLGTWVKDSRTKTDRFIPAQRGAESAEETDSRLKNDFLTTLGG